MSSAVRRLGRTVIVLGVVVGLVAAGRAALGRLAGEPATSSRRGSFDAWPAVAPAPGRRAEDSGSPGPGPAGEGGGARPS